MRNPIRLKNLSMRFMPFYVIGLGILIYFPPTPIGIAIAVPPIALGLALRSWAAGHLVKNDSLTMTGPYAHIRHPLYAGTLLVSTGFAIVFGGLMAIVLIAAIWPWFAFKYYPRKEHIESERLEALYGDIYAKYREAVPALWPRWTGWRSVSVPSTGPEGHRDWALERYSDNNELGTVLAVLGGVTLMALRAFWIPG
jgi:protein-S-isoprenylcysteine O-methyltransferase Ste14